jgi:hypothetical protein
VRGNGGENSIKNERFERFDRSKDGEINAFGGPPHAKK